MGGDTAGRDGTQLVTAHWKECGRSGENREGLEVVSDSGAQEKKRHDGGCRRTGRRDRTWWLMEEHRKEGWDLVDDGGG